MLKKLITIALTFVTLLSLTSCNVAKEDKPTTGALTAPDYSMEITGRIARFTNGTVMLLSESAGEIALGGKMNLDGLNTGDKVTIYCDEVLETYPASTIVVEMVFHEKGTKDDLDEEILNKLLGLGYELESEKDEYTMIDMQKAKEIFATKGDYIILDVRRADEFADGHIPGAINVANEDIAETEPSALPDKNQTIYVYCRSGNRSKQAASKLVAMGYKNIIEFGGIIDWTGDIEK